MTTKLEHAARQALEALEEAYENGFLTGITGLKTIDVLTTLREALAEQAEQEPVAWGRVFDGDIIDCICPEEHALNEGDYTIPLYASPVRTKDLTDDEIREMFNGYVAPETLLMFRAVIAKDREKNK